MSMPLIAAVALGAALGGFVQGLSGFAFGLVALGIWAWSVDPTVAGPLVVFGWMVGQRLSLPTVRGGFDRGRVLPFILGGLIGVPIGVALLRLIDPLGFKLAVGIILLIWCPAMLLLRDLRRVSGGGCWADAVVGWIGGGVRGGRGRRVERGRDGRAGRPARAGPDPVVRPARLGSGCAARGVPELQP